MKRKIVVKGRTKKDPVNHPPGFGLDCEYHKEDHTCCIPHIPEHFKREGEKVLFCNAFRCMKSQLWFMKIGYNKAIGYFP